MADPTPPTIEIAAGVDQLAAVRDFVRTHVAAAGGDDEAITDLVQAVDELVCNVVEHRYAGRPGTVEIAFIETPDDIAFRFRDDAPPFDPTGVPSRRWTSSGVSPSVPGSEPVSVRIGHPG